jgi:hypothetical protein
MPAYNIPKSVLQVGGVASVLAGILLIAGFGLHPAGEDPTLGTDPLWVPAHGLLWVAFTIALLGWIGLYIVQASRAGRLGTAGFVVILLGTSLASWIFSSDVTYVPVIAAQSPGLFAQILNRGHILIGVLSVLTWILGNVLFGFSIIGSSVFPKWAGVLLVIGSLVIPVAYLTGLPEKIVAIGGFFVGASQIWLGSDLFRILRKSTISA